MAQGIGLAGGFGAGGARDALVDLIAQRLAQEQFDEQKRARGVAETQSAAELAQRASEATASQGLSRAQMAQQNRQFGENLGLDVKRFGENVRQFDTGMKVRGQESAQDQANKDRGFERGVHEFDVTSTEGGRHNRAMEGLAGSRIGTGAGNRTVKISYADPDTGQVFEEYVTPQEARERGPMRKANAALTGKLAPIKDYIAQVDDVLATGEASGWADTGPFEARLRGALPGGAGFSEEGESLRNKMGNLFSLLAHERFGGALTEHEIGRARSFLPEPTDTPQRLKSKLTNLRRFMESKLSNLSGSATIRGEAGVVNDPRGGVPGAGQVFDFDPKTGRPVPRR